MNEEIDAIEINQTWDLVDIPANKTSIGVKWVYKMYGIDYDETFAPVARMDTIKSVLAIAAQNQWPVYQMDVKYAFLNVILEEEVYVDQPPGYTVKGHEHKVFKLKKALYGVKQAP